MWERFCASITQVLGRGDGLDGVHGLLEHGLGDDGRLHDHALGGLSLREQRRASSPNGRGAP